MTLSVLCAYVSLVLFACSIGKSRGRGLVNWAGFLLALAFCLPMLPRL